MTIRSRPATPEYRKHFDRVFKSGNSEKAPKISESKKSKKPKEKPNEQGGTNAERRTENDSVGTKPS